MIERETNFVLGSSEAQTETVDTPEGRRGPAGTAMQPDVREEKTKNLNDGEERMELSHPMKRRSFARAGIKSRPASSMNRAAP